MAQWGGIVTQRADMQATGPDTLMPVQRVTVRTNPTGVVFDYLVPEASYDAGAVDATVGAVSQSIEETVGLGGVVGATYEEDLDNSGFLVGYLVFTVTVPPRSALLPGPHTAEVRIPLGYFGESFLRSTIVGMIENAKADLAVWVNA